jgi:hypothetical protein
MIEKKHRTLASVYLVIDAVASSLAMLAAWALRFQFEVIPVTKGQQDFETYARLLPIIVIVFPLAFAVQGLYRIRPTRSRSEEWVRSSAPSSCRACCCGSVPRKATSFRTRARRCSCS